MFISEDDLKTFEGWLKYQGVDATTATPDELAIHQRFFDEVRKRTLAKPKIGRMKRQPILGEHRYAVAVREGSDLFLALWVKHSVKGEFFVMLPRLDQDWDVHASYHLDGMRHIKSDGRMALPPVKRQPLTAAFRGTENLVSFAGYGPKTVGAICDPSAFTAVVELAPGILRSNDGQIAVDLVGPNCQPSALPWTKIVRQEVFHDMFPGVMITIGSFS